VRTVGQAEGRDWLVTLATCRVQIPQHPVRVGDLNVFRKQEQALEQIKRDYKDQVLFCTSDTLWLMLPAQTRLSDEEREKETQSHLEQSLASATKQDFWVEARSLQGISLRPKQLEIQRLRWHNDAPTRQDSNVREAAVYGELEKEFDPPVCSICQMRAATKQWPRDSHD